MRLLFWGDSAPSGFGTVTSDLGRELLALGIDVRFVSQNDTGTNLPEPFLSRTADVASLVQGISEGQTGVVGASDLIPSLVYGSAPVKLTSGEPWGDWKPEACILLGDYRAAQIIVQRAVEAFRSIPTLHYVPIEGTDLPPAWKELWEIVHPVAMSRFGAKQIAKVMGHPVPMIYHGVDTEAFRPASVRPVTIRPAEGVSASFATKEACKVQWAQVLAKINNVERIPRKWLLRTDRNMPRKQYARMLRALAPVLARNQGWGLVIHCSVFDQGGMLADSASKHPTVRDRILFTDLSLEREALVMLYNAADLYVSNSAEGFGLTIAEAIACFPADTKVQAADVQNGMVRRYTGPLVRVSTDRGTVEATPEHPFWTDNGWCNAGDLTLRHRLLYTGIDERAIHRGRVADVAASFADSHDLPDRAGAGTQLLIRAVGEASGGITTLVRRHQPSAPSEVVKDPVGLCRRSYRWRGNSLYPSYVWTEDEAVLPDSEYVCRVDRLAVSGANGTIGPDRAFQDTSGDSDVSVRGPGLVTPAALQSALALLGHQAPADGDGYHLLSPQTGAGLDGPAERAAVSAHLNRPSSEYSAVTKIERREVVDLPVYNLKTASGTYVAGGFLVHNCGVPAVGVRYSAVPEVIGPAGVTVERYIQIDNEYDHYWCAVDESAFGAAVEKLMLADAHREALGAKGPKHIASSFSWAAAARKFAELLESEVAAWQPSPVPPQSGSTSKPPPPPASSPKASLVATSA